MKRTIYFWLCCMILAGLTVSLAAAQSQETGLGQYARTKKQEKAGAAPAKRVYDNENLPHDQNVSVVGQASTSDPATASTDVPSPTQASDPANSDPNKTTTTPGESAEDRQKVYGDWQSKINDQKQATDLLQRELDVLQREYRLRAAAVYSDVGYRLRNSTQWDKEDAQYKENIATKQKALDAAKQKLADLQEQARKSGVPSKMRE